MTKTLALGGMLSLAIVAALVSREREEEMDREEQLRQHARKQRTTKALMDKAFEPTSKTLSRFSQEAIQEAVERRGNDQAQAEGQARMSAKMARRAERARKAEAGKAKGDAR